MKKIRLGIFGAGGKMGKEVSTLAVTQKHIEIVPVNTKSKTKLDVVIDFSSPKGALELSRWCVKTKTPLVSGTTGFTPTEEKKFKSTGQSIPFFYAANMSLGINAMAQALIQFSENFSEADVQIEEIHHRHKKDAPSGTAKFLERQISPHLGSRKMQPTVSLRGGEVFGIHKVYFFSQSEWVCFEHQALNRTVFAEGALKAAQWILSQKPGSYTMTDLLKTHGF